MRALYLKGVKEVAIKEAERPKANGHDPLIKVSACGICGTDISAWKIGYNALCAFGGIMDGPSCPTLGHEFVGTLIDPGDAAAKGFKAGDRVTMMPFDFCGECPSCINGMENICWEGWTKRSVGILKDGAFADEVLGFSKWLYKIPDDITDEEACMIEPLAVSVHAVRKGDIRIGDNVLIIGAGPIGMLAGALAKAGGAAKVTIAELNTERAKKAVELGCGDAIIDMGKEDAPLQLMTAAGAKGFDCALECTGTGSGFDTAITFIAHGGHVVIIGTSTAPISISSIHLQKNEPIVSGVLGYKVDDFDIAYDLVVNKKIDAKKFVTGTVAFEDIQTAFERLTDPTGNDIKICVKIN